MSVLVAAAERNAQEVSSRLGTQYLVEQRTARLHETERVLRSVIEALDGALCIIGAGGVVLDANHRWPATVGSSFFDWCRDATDLQPLLAQAAPLVRAVTDADPVAAEERSTAVKGRIGQGEGNRWMILRIHPIRDHHVARAVVTLIDITDGMRTQEALARRTEEAQRLALVARATDNAVAITDAHGVIGRSLLLSVRPLHPQDHGEDAEPGGAAVVGVAADITHVRDMEHQLAQANRLESIGQLASGIAHEINTPVQLVSDNTQFLTQATAEVMGLLADLQHVLAPANGTEDHRRIDPGDDADQVRAARALLDRLERDELREDIPDALTDCRDGLDRVAQIVRALKDYAHPGQRPRRHRRQPGHPVHGPGLPQRVEVRRPARPGPRPGRPARPGLRGRVQAGRRQHDRERRPRHRRRPRPPSRRTPGPDHHQHPSHRDRDVDHHCR